ncbi:uncharacterized protein LOC127253561 [Andrographis paniculata]|uniref:uncharacterized protein LOC127253561 n=1 Tax=Andrographis paniculata TaxID=175694 RepID=UPI0021E88582|nr:uncharacterized protein LOC127253561 [Andrographis paniculata]
MATDNFVQPAIPRFDGHYDHWSMLMENFLRSKEYWQVVESGIVGPATTVPLIDAEKTELTALKNDTSKDIWDSMKKKYQGNLRAKRAQLQALCGEFETLPMKFGERVSDYFSRTMAIAEKMWIHGDTLEDVAIVEKIFRSMLAKYNYFVCSIEESKDLDSLSIDELQGSLLIHERKLNLQDNEEHALKASSNNHSFISRGGR